MNYFIVHHQKDKSDTLTSLHTICQRDDCQLITIKSKTEMTSFATGLVTAQKLYTIEDDDMLTFISDDTMVKDWAFLTVAATMLSAGKHFVTNTFEYPIIYQPSGEYHELVKHIFDKKLTILPLNRNVFICNYIYIHTIGDMICREYMGDGDELYEMFNYKINRVLGANSIGYLGGESSVFIA